MAKALLQNPWTSLTRRLLKEESGLWLQFENNLIFKKSLEADFHSQTEAEQLLSQESFLLLLNLIGNTPL